MGDVVEMREHRVREFLRGKVGRTRVGLVVGFVKSGSVCDSFVYSAGSDLVYIEPELLRRFMDSRDKAQLLALDLVLDALQKAPGEIKDLLATDAEYEKNRGCGRG
ncbi:MAG TPA: hypothetical protein VMX35_14395 [Acidobacteriota bacterium]|nr:hypothetical protein [Acidobacteriota bacterium]